jgi:hypothetical protein
MTKKEESDCHNRSGPLVRPAIGLDGNGREPMTTPSGAAAAGRGLESASDYVSATRNRALSLLAENPHGRTVPVMLADGFSIELLNQLIRVGLVSARTKRLITERSIELVHMEITDMGRRVLVTDARPKRRVPDNLDDVPAPIDSLIGRTRLETILRKQTLIDGEHIRALALLAENPDGYTKAMMLGRGFSLALTTSLIRAGLAIDKRLGPGRGPVARVRITGAGRSALAQHERGSTEPV